MNQISEVYTCKSTDDIIDYLFNINLHNCVFRGVSNSEYGIASTLERFFVENDYSRNSLVELELFNEFIKNEKKDECDYKDLDSLMSVLADMRHGGIFTRLLDWTHDINVSMFFASRNNEKASKKAIYALDLSRLSKIQFICDESLTQSQNYFLNSECEVNYYELPKGNVIRLDNQKGLFLINREINYGFIHNLYSSRKNIITDTIVYKFILTKEKDEEILMDLSKKYNINDDYLFPGKDYDTDKYKGIATETIRKIYKK